MVGIIWINFGKFVVEQLQLKTYRDIEDDIYLREPFHSICLYTKSEWTLHCMDNARTDNLIVI